MHFNLVIPICLLVISFAFFNEVLCEENMIIATNNNYARLSRRGKFSKRCGQTSPPASGCHPFPTVVDPITGTTNGVNSATQSLPLQGLSSVPATNGVTGYAPAQVYPAAPVTDPLATNPLGLNTVTGSVLSTFPNLGGAPIYPTASQQVAQAPQPVAQAQPVAQTQPVAQAQPAAQAPVFGSSSIYPGILPIGTSTSTSAADSNKAGKKSEDDDDDDDDDDKKKSGSDNEDDDDSNNEDDDEEE